MLFFNAIKPEENECGYTRTIRRPTTERDCKYIPCNSLLNEKKKSKQKTVAERAMQIRVVKEVYHSKCMVELAPVTSFEYKMFRVLPSPGQPTNNGKMRASNRTDLEMPYTPESGRK